jgi:hypothetical protein
LGCDGFDLIKYSRHPRWTQGPSTARNFAFAKFLFAQDDKI